ncbi:hypothetical protein BSL78_19869 [Paramuricea clavata]|uniref:Uncharacterized protein n=1 Tax=Paramuricea clavata TaxID=317549 RepID=A0A6S7JA45_PARCT|nr:hypothetical protein BSL78_19869 [Paramuricea clavata]
MAQQQLGKKSVEIYSRRFALEQRVLAQYADKSIKIVWFERGSSGGKCFLAKAQPTTNIGKALYKSAVQLSPDDMLRVCECLDKANRTGTNYFQISESTDWKGDLLRLVLKDSEYQGLLLCYHKAVGEDLEMACDSDETSEDLDPDPVEKIASEDLVTNLKWNECFEKFYISKKDNWNYLASQLREFCVDVSNVHRVDQESRLPTSSAEPVKSGVEQIPLSGVADDKTKNTVLPKPKRKRIKEVRFEEAVSHLLSYMYFYNLSSSEVWGKYGVEINKMLPYDYALMIRVGDAELKRMSELLNKEEHKNKLHKYNSSQESAIMMSKRKKPVKFIADELIKKASRLLKGEKLTKEQLDAYSLHAKRRHKYKRLKIYVNKPNAQWSIDLADLNNLSGYNNQYRYILVCVDVYTRYVFVKLLKK